MSEAGSGEDAVDLALAHPRPERSPEVREGAIEDVARGAHPLDLPGALAQACCPDKFRRVEAPDTYRQEIDDTGGRRVHRAERVDSDRVRVSLPEHVGEHLA